MTSTGLDSLPLAGGSLHSDFDDDDGDCDDDDGVDCDDGDDDYDVGAYDDDQEQGEPW